MTAARKSANTLSLEWRQTLLWCKGKIPQLAGGLLAWLTVCTKIDATFIAS